MAHELLLHTVQPLSHMFTQQTAPGCWRDTGGQERSSGRGQTVSVTTKKGHGQTHGRWGRGECDGNNNLVLPHCLWGRGCLLPRTLTTCHLCRRPQQGHPQLRVRVSDMKIHNKLRPQVCGHQGQGRHRGRKQGRRERRREPSRPSCPLPPATSPGMAEEAATSVSVSWGRGKWWPTEAHSLAPGPEV